MSGVRGLLSFVHPIPARFCSRLSMLQRHTYQEPQPDGDSGFALTPQYFFDVLKRRAFYFAIPFVAILAIGSVVTAIWPARYVAQGTILVQSQEIPSDLVRPDDRGPCQ